ILGVPLHELPGQRIQPASDLDAIHGDYALLQACRVSLLGLLLLLFLRHWTAFLGRLSSTPRLRASRLPMEQVRRMFEESNADILFSRESVSSRGEKTFPRGTHWPKTPAQG